MKSIYFTEEHHAFRDNVRDFVTREVVPHAPKWEADRMIPKHFWKSLGDLGYLGINHPEVFGGSEADFFILLCSSKKFLGPVLAVCQRL